jgi:hypothetical protein
MRRITLLLTALILSGNLWAAVPQESVPNTKSQKPAKEQHGTVANPVFEQLANPQPNSQQAATETGELHNQTDALRQTVHVTWVLAIATLVLAGIAGWQVLESRRATQRQLRAYVSVHPRQEFDENHVPIADRYRFGIRNHGQTPAYKFRFWALIGVGDFPLKGPLLGSPEHMPVIETVLSPGPECERSIIQDKILSADEMLAIKNGTHALYAWGMVNYNDAFGVGRWTSFCFFIDKAGLNMRRWAFYGIHNDADQENNNPPF